MLTLLKVEWMKVKNYTTFWVLTILYLVSVFGAAYISHFIYISIQESLIKKGGPAAQAFIGNAFDYPDIWHTISYASSLLMFMLGLLIIISMTNEYSYKTHRQNIIDGWSRKEFISVKMLLTVIISIVATVAVFINVVVFGFIQGTPFSTEKIEFIGYFFIQALSYSSAALLFSVLFKRSGITIGVYFLYTAIIEKIVVQLLNHYADNTGRYMPLETSNNLIRMPIFKIITSQFGPSYNTQFLLISAVIYLALFYFISWYKFQKSDL